MLKNIASLLVAVFLVGCANTSTIKSEQSLFEGKTVVIVPTGKLQVESVSNALGGTFGLIGLLVEQAVTDTSRKKEVSIIEDSVNPFKTADVIINKNIGKFGKIKSQNTIERQLPFDEFTNWFNGDKRNDIAAIRNSNPDIIIDYGFQGINTTTYMIGTYAEGSFGMRVVDASNGKILARVRTFAAGTSGIKLNVGKDSPEYPAELVSAFNSLVEKLTMEAIDKITK
jgi:hypothetical protein